jgi:hypothetical protein
MMIKEGNLKQVGKFQRIGKVIDNIPQEFKDYIIKQIEANIPNDTELVLLDGTLYVEGYIKEKEAQPCMRCGKPGRLVINPYIQDVDGIEQKEVLCEFCVSENR